MQSLGAVTATQLKASGQAPKLKFEVYYGGAWVDLCDLGGVNYLKSISMSLGGASMTPDPVAGTWSATLADPAAEFNPKNTAGAYNDYLTTGTKIRISTGGTYGGADTYWVRMTGVMNSPKFKIDPPEISLSGYDYSQYLTDYKFKSPENYWGDSTTISTTAPDETLDAEMYTDENDALEIGAGEADNVTNWAADGGATISSEADTGGGSVYVMKILFENGSVTKTYSAAGTYSWTCPEGVTSIDVECWGGGGGGGSSTSFYAAGAGGGGAYVKSTSVTVVPGTTYIIQVGARGIGGKSGRGGTNGGNSFFDALTTVKAAGGKGGEGSTLTKGNGGAGGLAVNSVGDTKYSGGTGGGGNGSARGAGGGGGSSAGTGSAGNDGANGGTYYGGSGGAAPAGGGPGGDGGNDDTSGSTPSSAPGGGGGGAGWWDAAATAPSGGNGKPGKVVLTYTGPTDSDSIYNEATTAASVTADQMYKVTFKYQRTVGPGELACRAYVGSGADWTRQEGEVSGLADDGTVGYATWDAQSASAANSWWSVCYGDGLYVSVSTGGTGRAMYSADGKAWVSAPTIEENQWASVCYGDGLFVAVASVLAGGTNAVATSGDGINWIGRAASEANIWRSVCYGNGTYVAVSSDGTNRVMYSTDGITWTAAAAGEDNQWYSVCYGNGIFVAVSLDGTNRTMSSADGITWTAHAAAEDNAWRSVCFGNDLFVAVAADGTNRVMTSTDGASWTARAAAEANYWNSVCYGDGYYIAVARDGTNRTMTSTNGTDWTAVAAAEANTWNGVCYGDQQFVAVAYDGTNRVMRSIGIPVYSDALFYFTASEANALKLSFDITNADLGTEFRIDEISIKAVTYIAYISAYSLPDEATGIFYATLDGVQLNYGEDPDGYFYDSVHNEFEFHANRAVMGGTDNLVVYYYIAQSPENIVADILALAGLYTGRQEALDAMTYTPTDIVINRVWFDPGTTALAAIQMLCERCNYRFYFKYDGTPVFIPAPTIKAAGAEDATFEVAPYLMVNQSLYEDDGEIWNDVEITGEDNTQSLGLDTTLSGNYFGEDSDDTSIAAHGRKTHAIDNDLFQSNDICDTKATEYLAAFKDAKHYFGFKAAHNAYPVELGDTLKVYARFTADSTPGSIYGIILYGQNLYAESGVVEALRGIVRDIKLEDDNAMYKLELE